MTVIERYAITLPGTPGTHAPPRVVTVHSTGRLGVDGRVVYADESGTFLVYISADGVAEPLADEPSPNHTRPLHAEPLPRESATQEPGAGADQEAIPCSAGSGSPGVSGAVGGGWPSAPARAG